MGAPIDLQIDLSEWNQYAFDLVTASGRVGALAATVVRKSAADNERDQKILVAVDTGFLQGSIGTSFEGDGRSGTFTAEIGPTAHYGVFVEAGTSRMAGQPYVGPAFDRNLSGFIGALALVAEQAME